MNKIKRQASVEAQRLVYRLWATHWVQNERSFESAKSAAIICARAMMKEAKACIKLNYWDAVDIKSLPEKMQDRISVLKLIPQSIYQVKYKK